MACEHIITRRVEFSETDMAGIVHFTNFFRYMEQVEHSFCRSLGFSVSMPHHDPPMGLPRVHASCDFRKPLRFEDVVELRLLVAEKRPRSIAYQVRMRRLEPGPSEEAAIGRMVVACVQKQPDGRFEAAPLPGFIADRIEAAPQEWLAPAATPSRPQ